MRYALVTVLIALFLPAPADASRLGAYFSMKTLPRDWATPYPLRDGVPVVSYPWGLERNPVTIAQYGLATHSIWTRYHDKARWQQTVTAANWLVRTQKADGTWRYSFAYNPPGGELAAGWSSALAQGHALSLLVRVQQRRPHRRYLRGIRRAIGPLQRPVAHGGLARRWNGNLYFEEYPTAQPNYVLNGNVLTLIGLHDAALVDRRARRLWHRGVSGQARTLALFDSHTGRAYYNAVSRVFAPTDYDQVLRQGLRELTRRTGRRVFARYAARWNAV